jgi:hypothetical protein
MVTRYNGQCKRPISVITKWALASAALVRSVLTHNAERRIMRHGQIDGQAAPHRPRGGFGIIWPNFREGWTADIDQSRTTSIALYRDIFVG